MRDRRAKGISGVEQRVFISDENDSAIDRLVLELRLSYGVNITRKELINLAIRMFLAHRLEDLARYIQRT